MKSFPVYKGLRVLLVDLGLRPNDILRRAGLPDDLFTRPGATLTTTEYFGLWRAIEEEANEPALPIRLGEALRVEVFDPAIFAAMCSPDLNTALRRISRYKRLIVPMALHVTEGPRVTRLEIEWLDRT